MLVYEGTKASFMEDVMYDRIENNIQTAVLEKLGRHTPEAEYRSWHNSMQYMFRVMTSRSIPDEAGIAIEYAIPQTAKRIDFMISGYGENQEPNIVLIELKQWERAEAIEGREHLVQTFLGGGNRTVVHPSYQVWSYQSLLSDFNSKVINGGINIKSCVYLHNYRLQDNDDLLKPQYEDIVSLSPIYGAGDVPHLQSFISNSIVSGDKERVLLGLDGADLRPSKSLQDSITSMLQGNQEFLLIDDQKVAYEEILYAVKESYRDRKKRVIIVQGGPGTGKSVIAVNLLAKLTKEGYAAQYCSKNSAPRAVYKYKLKGTFKVKDIDNLFKGSASYTDLPSDYLDAVIVDEAHRLNDKNRYNKNSGNQIEEIIKAARCSIFFIDESQRVTLADIGRRTTIENYSMAAAAELEYFKLTSQFRCNGSDGYLDFVDDVLEIRHTADFDVNDLNYDIRVFDSPREVFDEIKKRNEINNKSRMLAGYCWEWDKEGRSDPEHADIIIGDFKMSWNLASDIYAVEDHSINQVGCIHTSQGIEFDYVGLIIGDDMRYENGKIVTDYTKRAKTDKSLFGIKKMAREDEEAAQRAADEIIKNTYRTLMTRGMKGCYIYCTDPNLSEYLKERISVNRYQEISSEEMGICSLEGENTNGET